MSATAPSAWRLQAVIAHAQQTLECLRTEHGQVIEDDAEILTALRAEGIRVEDLLRRLGRCALNARADAAAVNARIDDLVNRRDRYRRHEATYRTVITQVMEAIPLKSFRDPEFSLGLRDAQPGVVVTDPDALPAAYLRSRTIVTADTALIRAALENGEAVAGACLGNAGPILTVKSK